MPGVWRRGYPQIGTLTGSGGGVISLDTGVVYYDTPDDNPAATTLDFPDGMLQVTDAYIQGDPGRGGGPGITNTGFLDITGTGGHQPLGMLNDGTIRVSGTSDLPLIQLDNQLTGVLDIESDVNLTGAVNGVNLVNSGTIRKSGWHGGGEPDRSVLQRRRIAGYRVRIAGLPGRGTAIAGPIQIATGAVLDFDTGHAVLCAGNAQLDRRRHCDDEQRLVRRAQRGLRRRDASAAAARDFAPGILTFAGGFIDEKPGAGTEVVNTGTITFAASGGPLGTMYSSGTIDFAGPGNSMWRKVRASRTCPAA